MIENKLSKWASAGLITSSQADAIRKFEQSDQRATSSLEGPALSTVAPSAKPRNWGLWGVIAIGLTAMLAGIVSLIAANWDGTPSWLKLGVYFIVMIGIAWQLVRKFPTASLVSEALNVAFVVLLLAGIGLIAQIFHVKPSGWHGVAFWLSISLPIMLLATRRMAVDVWVIGFIVLQYQLAFGAWSNNSEVSANWVAYWVFLPYLFMGAMPLAHVLGVQGKAWPKVFLHYGLFASIVVLPMTLEMVWRILRLVESGYASRDMEFYRALLLRLWAPLAGIALCGMSWWRVSHPERRKHLVCFFAALVAGWVFMALTIYAASSGMVSNRMVARIIGLVGVLTIWGFAAGAAAHMGAKRFFDLLTLGIMIRVITVYFEVFGSLAQTGVGLILSGAFILMAAYGWHKYRYRLASSLVGKS